MERRTLDEFLAHEWPKVEYLLAPWLPQRGLVMLAGFRGVGKTFASLGTACAVASGAELLGWQPAGPAGVLLVDGEMDPAELQSRLRAFKAGLSAEQGRLAGENLRILTHADRRQGGIPNLADPMSGGQQLVTEAAGDCSLIILDNLSTLTAPLDGNKAESWQTMQEFLLRLRRAGKAVLVIEHAGKPNTETGWSSQRGTSRKEDVLNCSVLLYRSPGLSRDKFHWSWEKTRGFVPDADYFTVGIQWDGAGACRLGVVTKAELDEETAARDLAIQAAYGEKSVRETAKALGVSKSTVSRVWKKAGLIKGEASVPGDE